MKFRIFALLSLFFVAAPAVQAETLNVLGSCIKPRVIGTANTVQYKLMVYRLNSGTLISGLTTSKIKAFSVTEKRHTGGMGNDTIRSFPVRYSLAPLSGHSGVYILSITPANGNVWKAKSTSPFALYHYMFNAVISGISSADKGPLALLLE
jgi:hypothetical protein